MLSPASLLALATTRTPSRVARFTRILTLAGVLALAASRSATAQIWGPFAPATPGLSFAQLDPDQYHEMTIYVSQAWVYGWIDGEYFMLPTHGDGFSMVYQIHGGNEGNDCVIYGQATPPSYISLYTGDGADVIENNSNTVLLAATGGGNDTLLGGSGRDRFLGGEGDDNADGGGGDDLLEGGPGSDILMGGEGNDELHGGFGFDTLSGEGGNDEIWGHAPGEWFPDYVADNIDGGPGIDIAFGRISYTLNWFTGQWGWGGVDTLAGGVEASTVAIYYIFW